MADEPAGGDNQQQPDNGGAAFERHQAIPESFVKDNAYDFEGIGAALTEAGTLKAAAEDRAKLIPAKADDYAAELPKEFKLPDGYKWSADANDPTVKAARELASELKLTQPEFARLVQFEATRQSQEIANQRAFDAEQTKALGANADQRRKAASDWIDGRVKNKEAAAVLKTMLGYALGVEGLEAIIAGSNVNVRGDAGAGAGGNNENAELADQIGKQPMGRKLLDMANKAGK